jgi:hypothetical protein
VARRAVSPAREAEDSHSGPLGARETVFDDDASGDGPHPAGPVTVLLLQLARIRSGAGKPHSEHEALLGLELIVSCPVFPLPQPELNYGLLAIQNSAGPPVPILGTLGLLFAVGAQ